MAVADPTVPPAPVVPPEWQHEMDILKARVDFPLADKDLLQLMHGTPEQIRAAAEKLHEQALKMQTPPPQPPAPAPPTPTPPAPAATQPPVTPPAPVPAPTQTTPPEAVGDARYAELLYKVENKIAEPHERQEFFMSALRNGWNEQVGKMAARTR